MLFATAPQHSAVTIATTRSSKQATIGFIHNISLLSMDDRDGN
ncbi:hypothetical protein [Chamaesiphon sp.]